jgi:TonB family protein
MKTIFLIALSALSITARAQDTSKHASEIDTSKSSSGDKKEKAVTKVQSEASYLDWNLFLLKNLRYPNEEANRKMQNEANIEVMFIVDIDGKVSNVEAVSGPNKGGLREEAVHLIQSSGIWVPAVENSRPVKSYKRQTIVFDFRIPDAKHDPVKKLRGSMDSAAFFKLEIESQYPGGDAEWSNFLSRTMKYPDEAIKNRIQGVVVVQFIVDKDGSVSNIQVLSGPQDGGLREEAIRVIKRSGKWMPAFQYGKYVKSYKKQPFYFKLNNQ